MKKHDSGQSNESHELCFTRMGSPIGVLLLVGERRGKNLALRGIYFEGAAHAENVIPRGACEDGEVFADIAEQLRGYFDGTRRTFDIELAPHGTEFQRDVWRALAAIPYGATTTYAAIAHAIGRPRAVRAVGAANGRNPLSIVVPCHRVIGQDGTLTGYAGGMDVKRRLLDLESSAQATAP
jgi:methylated-DNA-[protein]-cysteine S-methyltransferase